MTIHNTLNGSLVENAKKYFARKFESGDLEIKKAFQIMGGVSRLTWRFDVEWTKPAHGERSIILHLDLPSTLLDNGRQVEYEMYKAFWEIPEVPVPEPLFIEDSPEPLGMPFLAVARAEGISRQSGIHRPEYSQSADRMARQVFKILGKIAAADVDLMGFSGVLPRPAPDELWSFELDRWEKLIKDSDIGPLPITEMVIRKLRRNPPPAPSRLSVVHGDYHFGNWLYTPEGITAIIDWEMAHLGDPHEDLAWCCLQNYRARSSPDKVMLVLEPEEAIRIWEESRGLKANREALRWWTLLAHVRATAFWAHAAHQFATNRSVTLDYAILGCWCISGQEAWMLDDFGGMREI